LAVFLLLFRAIFPQTHPVTVLGIDAGSCIFPEMESNKIKKMQRPRNPSADRVTRLGEFSPIRRLFTLGRFSKMTEVAQIIGEYIFDGLSCLLILAKKSVWLHYGQFFQKDIRSPCRQADVRGLRLLGTDVGCDLQHL
jgi:hypothetical protein